MQNPHRPLQERQVSNSYIATLWCTQTYSHTYAHKSIPTGVLIWIIYGQQMPLSRSSLGLCWTTAQTKLVHVGPWQTAITHNAADVGDRLNVNTDRPQLQLHRLLQSRGSSQFTLLHHWTRPWFIYARFARFVLVKYEIRYSEFKVQVYSWVYWH